ncbi:putative phospholipid glycerol acyltransferase [Phaeomoniella chlamydospora]|uniref:Putative phospholipid glycerol acyltransferase n=1 Tax=Phaeomoniella chlamydospora TaxID=158046 RepID=A0A0G2EMC3_PHACM|nr:putative phospholipid glycerol acyltransferase [Phaeomoniella chlamydospora]
MPTPKVDAGAGFSTAVQKAPKASDKQLQHGPASQVARSVGMGSFMLTGIMAINLTQMIGTPLYLINQDWYNAWIAFTKQSVGLLFTTMIQFWAPTNVVISGDKSMRGQLLKTVQGNLFCDFPERLVFIANHQIYTDWLYLWWIAYASGMHGRIYIVLKESLRRIPLIGWGMQFSKFIFLKRNWEQDKPNLARHLKHLNDPKEPMWLTIFPEGTNLAPSTRRASNKWAQKQGINDLRHCLLPRSTGLHFILEQLKDTTEWVYDCTIGYEGVPRGQYAQDIYTLRAQYAGGRRPKSVSMHFRRFKVSSIPLSDANAFDKWLRARWAEKDNLLEYYMQNGQFPADAGAEKYSDGRIRRGAGHIQTQVKTTKWYEFLQVFAPMGLLAMVLYSFYGDLPKRIIKSLQRQAILNKIEYVKRGTQQVTSINQGNVSGPKFTISNKEMAILKKAMAEKNVTINQEAIQKALNSGLFLPKDGLPINGKNQVAITDAAIKQASQIFGAGKGLTSAEKRARARQRLEAQRQQAKENGSTPALAMLPPKKAIKAPPMQKQIALKPAIAQPSKDVVPSKNASKPSHSAKSTSTSIGPAKVSSAQVKKHSLRNIGIVLDEVHPETRNQTEAFSQTTPAIEICAQAWDNTGRAYNPKAYSIFQTPWSAEINNQSETHSAAQT